MDKIKITDLELYCRHGVYPEERALGQKFVVSAVLYTDTRRAGMEDDLNASVDYGTVCHAMKTFLEEHTFRLIEAAAERLAWKLLLDFPKVERLQLELKKPWAPIGLPVKYASVEIERGWHTAYIALGSNIGDRKGYLDGAVEALKAAEGIRVEQVSDYIETEPYGVTDQDPFLNGALKIRTLLLPYELLERLHAVERQAHRERIRHWGPRTLDLDILFYDELILDEESLTIPHKDLQNRRFVLEPMKQLAPGLRHPVLHKTIEEMERELS